MAIRSDTFSSVQLSGEDATRFAEQVLNGAAPRAAAESAQRGKAMLETMRNHRAFTQKSSATEG